MKEPFHKNKKENKMLKEKMKISIEKLNKAKISFEIC